jgi:hypothetical protein
MSKIKIKTERQVPPKKEALPDVGRASVFWDSFCRTTSQPSCAASTRPRSRCLPATASQVPASVSAVEAVGVAVVRRRRLIPWVQIRQSVQKVQLTLSVPIRRSARKARSIPWVPIRRLVPKVQSIQSGRIRRLARKVRSIRSVQTIQSTRLVQMPWTALDRLRLES